MPGKSLTAQRDELIELQLKGIRDALDRLEKSVSDVSDNLDTVRIAELAAIRTNVADTATELRARIATLEGDMKVQQYAATKAGKVAGAWISSVISVIVAGLAALLMHKAG